MGDIGINTTTKIIDHLKERVAEEHITDPAECKQLLIDSIKDRWMSERRPIVLKTRNLWCW